MPNTEQSIEETGGVPEIVMEFEVAGMAQQPTDKTLSITDMPADAKTTGERLGQLEDEIEGVLLDFYPVGSIYMTTSDQAPAFLGTWVEIGITMSLAQMKNGKRGYSTLAQGDTGDAVHFWLRTA